MKILVGILKILRQMAELHFNSCLQKALANASEVLTCLQQLPISDHTKSQPHARDLLPDKQSHQWPVTPLQESPACPSSLMLPQAVVSLRSPKKKTPHRHTGF